MKTVRLSSLGAGAFFGMAGFLGAQTMQFDVVELTPTNHAGASGLYLTTEDSRSGTPISDSSYSLGAFNVRVGSGTGSAASLVGQEYLAFCVNFGFGGPATGENYQHTTTSSGFDYSPSSARDYWATDTAAKYDAIKDIVATHGQALAFMDQTTAEFQEWTVALTMAFNEVVADYGTGYSLSSGDLMVSLINNSDDPVLAASWSRILDKYNQAIASVGNGSGSSITLNAATITGGIFQDVIMIPVPEPAAPLLLGAAALLGVARRRRIS